jgi:peptidoglycan/LPS O-acetylase OafA/YrhL
MAQVLAHSGRREKKVQNRTRLPELDIARAFFAWWVVGCHCVINSGVPWDGGKGLIEKTLLQASWAVNGFLVLSGFVIAKLIIEKGESYGAYITRRFFRLYPTFLVCLLPSIFLFQRQPLGWFVAALGSHLTLLHGIVPESVSIGPVQNECFAASILPPAWSISLEWQYYLIAPLLVGALWKLRTRWWLLVALVCYAPICSKWGYLLNREWPLQSFLPLKMIYFFLGVCAYRAWPNGAAGLTLPGWTAPLQWLGKVSYSTYLLHWPVLVLLAIGLKPILERHSSGHQSVILFVCAAPLVIGLSALLYYTIEKTGIGWGRHIISTRGSSTAR